MNCTPSTLAQASTCWCLPEDTQRAALIYLLCQWSNHSSRPANVISWTPATAVATWTDSAGSHTGNLAAFLATPTWATTTSLDLHGKSLTAISNVSSLPLLQSLYLQSNQLTTLNLDGVTSLSGTLDVHVNSNLTTISSSTLQLLGPFNPTYCHALTSISFPVLTSLGSFAVGAIGGQPNLTTLYLPLLQTLTGNFTISGVVGLTSVSLPSLTASAGDILISQTNSSITSVSLQSLVSTGGSMEISGPIISSISFPNYTTCGSLVSVHSCPLLTSLTIYCTSQSGRSLGVYDMAGLTSLSLPNLVNPWGWNMVNNPALTQISAPNWTGALGAYTYTWNGGGLQANGTGGKLGVNDLLVLMNNATVGYHAATVNLAGGTNAVPTGAGATAKTALALKVLSLTTNI